MQGAIVDTACAIATESREQIIDMKNTALVDITRGGHGKSVPFSIELVNCTLERADKNSRTGNSFKLPLTAMLMARHSVSTAISLAWR